MKEREIVAFNNPGELKEKIEYYLHRPDLRSNIGTAAQRRAYAEHTYKHRLVKIFNSIGKSVSLKSSIGNKQEASDIYIPPK